MKILAIVETHFVARGLREHLENLEHKDVVIVTSAPDAGDQLVNNTFDLILLDAEWLKPGISVMDFMKSIREKEATKHVPIMLCSSKSRSEDIRLALQSGANDFLRKPYSREVLKEHINKFATEVAGQEQT